MQPALKNILDIQEFDIKMIRLMRIKKQRENELAEIESLTEDLVDQKQQKEAEIESLGEKVNSLETRISEVDEKVKELEGKQSTIKKVDEFNALTQEMTAAEREKIALEQETSNLLDERSAEEEVLEKIKESLTATDENSKALKDEIFSAISMVNQEGKELKEKRDLIMEKADGHLLAVYQRLLRNKKDRVIVPVENRTCSGCHVGITIQQENLVRKGEAIVHCEHCSRILYWQDDVAEETKSATGTSRRRRRAAASS